MAGYNTSSMEDQLWKYQVDRGSWHRIEPMILARQLHSYGFVPIPLHDKVPVISRWEQTNYNEALTIFERSLKNRSRATNNVGVLNGHVPSAPFNFVVVDVDVDRNGMSTWKQYIQHYGEPDTYRVRTGRAGMHYYFLYNDRVKHFKNMKDILGVGIDFKTDGGQILAPGSVNYTTNAAYLVLGGMPDNRLQILEMPDWLFNVLQQHENDLSTRRK